MAEVDQEEPRKYIQCLVLHLPPGITSWSEFISNVAVECFPLDLLPVKKDEDEDYYLNADGTFQIYESENTLQLVDIRQSSKGKYSISFKIPYPDETDDFYEFIMSDVIEKLTTSPPKTCVRLNRYDTDDNFKGFIMLSLIRPKSSKKDAASRIPSQQRFKKTQDV